MFLEKSGSDVLEADQFRLIEFERMTTTCSAISDGAGSARNDSKYVAHNMILKFSVSMALKAVLELGIPDILFKAEGERLLSAAEILAQLPTKSTPGPTSYSNLRRLLTPLVREGFFRESLNGDEQPVYGLTDVSKWFIRSSESDMTAIADLQLSTLSFAAWDSLHEVILDETTVPFVKAHKLDFFEYCNKQNMEYGALRQDAMLGYLHFHKSKSIDDFQQCGMLDGVTTLVDVGGGWGATTSEIVARCRHIECINFDLPRVIATAPPITGVKHVAGNYFDAVPSGDLLFLKMVIHDNGDEDAVKILKNCFKALPKNGKVILAEYMLNKEDNSALAVYTEYMDLTLLANVRGARERTRQEYHGLLLAAGFKTIRIIHNLDSYDFIEARRD